MSKLKELLTLVVPKITWMRIGFYLAIAVFVVSTYNHFNIN